MGALFAILHLFTPAAYRVRPVAPFQTIGSNTNSMLPVLMPGQIHSVIDKPFLDVVPGEIILFDWRARGIYVSHRVQYIKRAGNGERYFITKGDNNPSIDSFHTTAADYIGVLIP